MLVECLLKFFFQFVSEAVCLYGETYKSMVILICHHRTFLPTLSYTELVNLENGYVETPHVVVADCLLLSCFLVTLPPVGYEWS